MTDDLVITDMLVGDVPRVAAIEAQVYPSPWSARSFASEVTTNHCAVYVVARIGDELVGYAGMWVFLGEAHVTTIAVDPRFQGRGIGHRLLSELISRAVARDATCMSLEVRPSNHPALGLYEKFGFQPRGRRRGYYCDTGEDAIVMWNDNIGRYETTAGVDPGVQS